MIHRLKTWTFIHSHCSTWYNILLAIGCQPIRSQYAATLPAHHLPTVPIVRTQRTIRLCIVSHYHMSRVLNVGDCIRSIHETQLVLPPPAKIPTPYGGQLAWTLPGGNLLYVHIKDKNKIRHKKRWSQVLRNVLYRSTLSVKCIVNYLLHMWRCRGYSDTELYLHFHCNDTTVSTAGWEDYIAEISHWMSANRLKLNMDKTGWLLAGSRQGLSLLDDIHLKLMLGAATIAAVDSVRLLGVDVDRHVSKVAAH